MFPPLTGPPVTPRPPHNLGVWARLESKSATTEADLARTATSDPNVDLWVLAGATKLILGWLFTLFQS